MINWLLSGGAVPALLLACGIFFLFYLKGGPFAHPKRMIGILGASSKQEGISPRRALMLALAGTLGVGNLIGVANAVYLGGAGAVFWMWVSALVAMILKYAEILLAVAHRREGKHGYFGGTYYYIKDILTDKRMTRLASCLSGIFAILMILNALSTGCIIQANAVSAALGGVLHLSPWAMGLLLVALTLPFLLRGVKSISALTEILVPIMTGGYLILSLAVLILRRDALGEAFGSIFREAFSKEALSGGLIGFFCSRSLRVGTMRGLLSNEAGCGTAPTAHAAADTESPAAQGVWGIFEVFVDTILLCTATALVILVSYPQVSFLGNDPMMMSIRAYSSVLGPFADYFFCGAVFCFAWATLLCWANYGLESIRYLSSKKLPRALYVLSFSVCTAIGAVIAPSAIWDLADFSLAALTTLNLIFLVLMRREVREQTLLTFDPKSLERQDLQIKRQE